MQREEVNIKRKAEIGVMQPQAKECEQLLEVEKEKLICF